MEGEQKTQTGLASCLVMFIMSVKRAPLVLATARLSRLLHVSRRKRGVWENGVEKEHTLFIVSNTVTRMDDPAQQARKADFRGHGSIVSRRWLWCCSMGLTDLSRAFGAVNAAHVSPWSLLSSVSAYPEQPGPLMPGEAAHSTTRH